MRYFPIITGIFVAVLMISQVAATKIVSIAGFSFAGAVFVFPISYLFGDVLTEVYGFARSRLVIWTGFAANVAMSLIFLIVGAMPGEPGWVAAGGQQAWDMLLGLTPRIALASVISYLIGEFLNSYVLAKLKVAMAGRHLWVRTIGSTIVGEGVDTFFFVLISFAGVLPWPLLWEVMAVNYVLKVAVEVVLTPVTYRVVGFLKRADGVDVYDRETNFNPFRLDLNDAEPSGNPLS